METKQKKSFSTKTPSWFLAFIVLIVAMFVFIITDSIWTPHVETGLKSHLINDLIISFGCFFIVRENPKSIWYVPLICNVPLILSSIVEPNFWKSIMYIPISGGWVLSLFVSIIAAQQGKRTQKIS